MTLFDAKAHAEQPFELVPRAPCDVCGLEYEVGDFDDGICMDCSLTAECSECAEEYPANQLVGDMCPRCTDTIGGHRDGFELESCIKCGVTSSLLEGLCGDCYEHEIFGAPL